MFLKKWIIGGKFLRQFLNHLHNEEILTSSKYRRLQYPKEVETHAVVLSREAVVQLINYCPDRKKKKKELLEIREIAQSKFHSKLPELEIL